MCGIAGFFTPDAVVTPEETFALSQKMGQSLYHRGPDGGDSWVDAACGLGLAHRRLAIIDLSEAGHQPMTSHDGRFVMVYNGEVYNADDLRPELEAQGHQFNGHSDSEVILNGFAQWGIETTVKRLIGMFAIALWDKREQCLYLIRDRLGIKPLYWYLNDKTLLFASELKAFHHHPAFEKKIDRQSVSSYLRHNCIPAPYSIYEKTQKLRAGHLLRLDRDFNPSIRAFWSMDDVVGQDQTDMSRVEAVEELEKLARDAVKRRMVSDVPLGAFLSGGIDSSLVAALMQAQSKNPVKTFSIGFEDQGYNEAVHAGEVAKHLGTDHTELYVTATEARDVIPSLPDYYDEPFADSSQIPTYLVSKMTREHVTVALSGDGGDELFGGYNRYFLAQKYAKTIFTLPPALRKIAAGTLNAFPPAFWDGVFNFVPKSKRPAQPSNKVQKLAGLLGGDLDDLYPHLVSHWGEPDKLVKGATERRDGPIWSEHSKSLVPDLIERMQYLDVLTYLPDDILTKVDRASMAVSLEARVPLLDHRLVEFAWRLPKDFKIHEGQGKWILRQVLYKYVPKELIERPKMGFGVPIDQWLRGPLKDWAGDLLHMENDLLDKELILQKWQEHQSGQQNWQYHLWDILMLQSWCARWK
ncbi:asparagine synthase (glutamine-hydrolyzing) [Terasakiella sp.]|uniref:asparagine synthase (glutamine-hydrolyzing) n=1 Tax=Terasakiella sp. TaxID=2034861 RepID=UPI003AA92947